ncbi:MAG: LamG-like jellyroll fold domain-containing protein, partial [Planctomycetota bacterium]|nr:LamG-like jellyroll fold domain-containing protein [Planctomycetota bacterium]
PSPKAPVKLNGKGLKYKRRHSALIESGTLPWISASLLEGEAEITIEVNRQATGPLELTNLVKGRSAIKANKAKLYEDSPGDDSKQGPSSSLGPAGDKDALDASIENCEQLSPTSITVELRTRLNSNFDFVDARGSGKDSQHGFVLDNRKPRVRYFIANEAGDNNEKEIRIEAGKELPRDKWVHIAFSYDAVSGRGVLYVDGQVAGEHQGPARRNLWWDNKTPKYAIAKGAKGAANLVDELRICNVSLPPGQLLQKGKVQVAADKVAGYWNMREAGEESGAELYTIRLVFAEMEEIKAGQRVFDVELQGTTRLEKLDIVKEAGGWNREIIKTIDDVSLGKDLRLKLKTRGELPPILSGLQVLRKAPK